MISTKSNINVKIDTEIKEQATQLLGRMGIDQTTAIDMFYRQIVAERRLPFQPIVNPTLEEQLVTAVMQSNPARIKLTADTDGNVLVDKKIHPDLHDWAENPIK